VHGLQLVVSAARGWRRHLGAALGRA
jgi:hypothetical protein